MRRAVPLFLIAVAGCAQSAGVGPSLARRPIEGRDLGEPVRAPVTPGPADAALQTEIAALRSQAEAGDRDFAALLSRTQAAAAAAGAPGSESWIAAQQALSALEGARAATAAALGRIDALLAERVLARDEAGITELQAAQQQVAGLAAMQQQAFERLQARVSR